ncbi:MAG: geranylgeranyl reductase family protein [Candidatus Odinarchaeota archaeon]
MYDVIISGAGPSGSKCAEVIAKAGYKVALIEKDINWRKPCGGGITYKVFNLCPELKKLNLHKINGITMYSADFHKLDFRLESNRYGAVIDRLELDNTIRNTAIDAGAQLFDKHFSFDLITKKGKQIGIKTRTPDGIKEYHGKIIVIADGVSSKLALRSGLRHKWKVNELGIGKCAILEGMNQLDEEFIYTFFMPYNGYGWIFPMGNNRFNIGVTTFNEANLQYNINDLYHDFLTNPNIKNYITQTDYKTIWEGSFPYPVGGILEKSLYSDNLMLVGDNGGFVSPISGEGIRSSIISGKVAGEIANNALQAESYSNTILKKYKAHPEIKMMIRSFKLKLSMLKFFYENNGSNFNRMLELTEQNPEFKVHVVNLFVSKALPLKDFLAKLKELS